MPTDGQRNKALRRERARAHRRIAAIQRDTLGEVTRLLSLAATNIAAQLAETPSEFQSFRLPQLQQSIQRELDQFAIAAGQRMTRGARESYQAGVAMIDLPVEAGMNTGGGAFRLSSQLIDVDSRPLLALSQGLTGRIKGISLAAVDRINSEIALLSIGSQSLTQAVGAVKRQLGKGTRSRALTVIRTELGRAHSIAGQQRFDQAREILPGLRKQWRRSGKLFSRELHDFADGQIVESDKPFLVGGESLMFPRDPAASAGNTINCGCASLPFMDSWDVSIPGARPFTPDEIARRPSRRTLPAGLEGV